MPSRQSSGFSRAVSWVPNLVVLAGLAALGYWGHRYHWTLPAFSEGHQPRGTKATGVGDERAAISGDEPKREADSPSATERLATGRLPAVEFPSAEAARNCGIEVGFAEQRQMDDVVVAHGVVDYDQTHFAQL